MRTKSFLYLCCHYIYVGVGETYFIRPIQIITEGENGREVALTLCSHTVMVVMVFRPSVKRDKLRRVEREVEPR